MPAEVRQSSLGTKPSYSGFCGECIWFTPRNSFMPKDEAERRVEEHNAIWHKEEVESEETLIESQVQADKYLGTV